MTEDTYMMIKPDGVRRGLQKEILRRLQAAGIEVLTQKETSLTKELAEKLYEVHKEKHFFDSLMEYALSGPVVLLKLRADNAVLKLRELIGATDPVKAAPGTIRGDLRDKNPPPNPSVMENLVHASDSPESAQRELKIFFS